MKHLLALSLALGAAFSSTPTLGQRVLLRSCSGAVSSLPSAGVGGRVCVVTDGASTSDCSTGGGSTRVLCYDDGAGWRPAQRADLLELELSLGGLSDVDLTGAATGDGLFYDGEEWVPVDVATQAELEALDTTADDLGDNDVTDLSDVSGTSGDGTVLVTTTGAQTEGDCVEIDAAGNHVASGGECGGGGGGAATEIDADGDGNPEAFVASSQVRFDPNNDTTPDVAVGRLADGVYVGGATSAGRVALIFGDDNRLHICRDNGTAAPTACPMTIKPYSFVSFGNVSSTTIGEFLFFNGLTDGGFRSLSATVMTQVYNGSAFVWGSNETSKQFAWSSDWWIGWSPDGTPYGSDADVKLGRLDAGLVALRSHAGTGAMVDVEPYSGSLPTCDSDHVGYAVDADGDWCVCNGSAGWEDLNAAGGGSC